MPFIDAQACNLRIECLARNPQLSRCPLGASDLSAALCKSCLDNLTLSVSARSDKWNSRAVPYLLGLALRRALACGLQARRGQDLLPAKNYAPFGKGLELA